MINWILGKQTIFVAIAFAAVLVFAGYKSLRLHIVTLERDKEAAARVVAEDTLKVIQRIRAAEIKALEKARKDDADRNEFDKETQRAIDRARQTDDAPIPPLLGDTYRRVYERYQSRVSED